MDKKLIFSAGGWKGGIGKMLWIAKIDHLVEKKIYLIVEIDIQKLYKLRTKHYEHQKWLFLTEYIWGS